MSDTEATEAADNDVPAIGADDVIGNDIGPSGALEPREVVRDRGYNDSTRKLFAEAAGKLKAQLEDQPDDDLEPAINHEPPVAADGASAGSHSTASQATSLPSAAAPASDPVAAVADTRAAAQLELREKAIADREAKLTAREAQHEAREKARERYAEKPGETIRDLIKEWAGVENDDDLRDEIADLITELSAVGLGLPIPDQHKARAESRKALRSVKQYKAELAKLESERSAKAEQAAQEARERQAVEGLAAELKPLTNKFPHLMAEDDPAGIVWDVIKTKHAREGTVPTWEECAALANDHFKKKHDAYFAKRRHLLAPTAPTAPVPAAAQPQGDPQSRRSSTLTNRSTAPVTATQPVDDDGSMDRDAHRRRSLGRLAGLVKERTA